MSTTPYKDPVCTLLKEWQKKATEHEGYITGRRHTQKELEDEIVYREQELARSVFVQAVAAAHGDTVIHNQIEKTLPSLQARISRARVDLENTLDALVRLRSEHAIIRARVDMLQCILDSETEEREEEAEPVIPEIARFYSPETKRYILP